MLISCIGATLLIIAVWQFATFGGRSKGAEARKNLTRVSERLRDAGSKLDPLAVELILGEVMNESRHFRYALWDCTTSKTLGGEINETLPNVCDSGTSQVLGVAWGYPALDRPKALELWIVQPGEEPKRITTPYGFWSWFLR